MGQAVASYPEQLLEQAEHLLRRDPRRPTQANARRATSTAYYALFHFLADEAGRCFVGGRSSKRALRAAVARALEHGSLRSACERIASRGAPANLPAALRGCWDVSISPELQQVAETLASLQELRHRADYDRATPIRRAQASSSVFAARQAMRSWKRIRDEEVAAFLLAALTWRNVAGR